MYAKTSTGTFEDGVNYANMHHMLRNFHAKNACKNFHKVSFSRLVAREKLLMILLFVVKILCSSPQPQNYFNSEIFPTYDMHLEHVNILLPNLIIISVQYFRYMNN